MIIDFVKAWDKNKIELETYFKTTKQSKYGSYKELLEALINKVINPYIDDEYYNNNETDCKIDNKLDTELIHEIDDGDYQGTIIFIVPLETYQPNISEYIVFNVFYGSCSGCDTLLSIQYESDSDIPTDEQVEGYMTLCLHILQSAFWLKR